MNNLDRERLKILQDKINRMDPVDIAERLEDLSKEDTAIWIKLLKKRPLGRRLFTFAKGQENRNDRLTI